MKKCQYCDQEIGDDAIICTHCGRAVMEPDREGIQAEIQRQEQRAHPKILALLRRFRWWGSVGLALGITIFCLGFTCLVALIGFEEVTHLEGQSDSMREVGEMIAGVLAVVSPLFVLPWLLTGLVGGFMLADKKLRGSGRWIWLAVLLVIPIALFLVYLAIMMLLGDLAYALARSAKPSKRRCPKCQKWIPYAATQCEHCQRPISPPAPRERQPNRDGNR